MRSGAACDLFEQNVVRMRGQVLIRPDANRVVDIDQQRLIVETIGPPAYRGENTEIAEFIPALILNGGAEIVFDVRRVARILKERRVE